jgi:FMN-dependent NADH-azoreductase
MENINKILRVNASARLTGSISRKLATQTIDRFASKGPVQVTIRELSEGLPFVDEDWVRANFTRPEQRSESHKAKLALSDSLVEELKAMDTLVLATPIYNFNIPAVLKAWIDMTARVGLTFNYTEAGPVGLLDKKRAVILLASGGTALGSEIDYATPYLRHALGFLGISDVTFIAADGLGAGAEEKISAALAAINELD